MSKVFRLHEGNNNIQDWGEVQPFKDNVVDSITDPNGGDSNKRITSIPSPFAIIDLVKTAFREVVKSDNLDGETIYHKMVADAMDVAEIFFNYEKLKDIVEIIKWNVDNLDQIGGALADSIRTYLKQDAKAYNFGEMHDIYLLNFKNGPKRLNIIGATSPVTLFFAPANDLSYATKSIVFADGDMPFDADLQPLYKRDIELVTYLYILSNQHGFSSKMPEFTDYLEKTYSAVMSDSERNGEDKDKLRCAKAVDIENYSELVIEGNAVEIIDGIRLHARPQLQIQGTSDFQLKSSVYNGEKTPLVLPNAAGNLYAGLYYTVGKWGNVNKAPESDSKPLDQRTLPFDGNQYPYLTIGDLLEDNIINIGLSDFNKEFFFDGNLTNSTSNNTSYLLPLRSEFFRFFTVEEARDIVKIDVVPGGSVKVTLTIPVKGRGNINSIKLSRLYEGVKYGIEKCRFALALTPPVLSSDDESAFYRAYVSLHETIAFQKFSLAFFYGDKKIDVGEKVVRCEGKNEYHNIVYSIDRHRFDSIEVTTDKGYKGIIIPTFRSNPAPRSAFTFAIDLGTTNTHIEYAVDSSRASHPLNISKEDVQVVMLCNDKRLDSVRKTYVSNELWPKFIGGAEDAYSFPTRTALLAGKNTNWNASPSPLREANALLTYEQNKVLDYNNVFTNIKWSNDNSSSSRIRVYIESLFLLLRGKVLMNGGDLTLTKIVWFYPISMTQGRFNIFKEEWDKAFAKYFPGASAKNISAMTESVAPYEYCKAKYGRADIVTVDIGGGTTDVVIASDGNIKMISSFRLGANNLFDNGFAGELSGDEPQNGILQLFKDEIVDKLDAKGLNELINIINDLWKANKTTDIASLFFSLKSNKDVIEKKQQDEVDFANILARDEKQKILFLLFFFAIVYHIANIIKVGGFNSPQYMVFSGNGSKIINVVTKDSALLSKLTRRIFELVIGKPYMHSKLEMVYNQPQPKESTCKGGITSPSAQPYSDIADLKKTLKGDNSGFVTSNDTYGAIDDRLIKNVSSCYREMLDMFFSICNEMNFANCFLIDKKAIEIAKSACYEDIDLHIKNGIDKKKKECSNQSDDDVREETLFFHPLAYSLCPLSAQILKEFKN